MLPPQSGATGIAWPQLDQPRPGGRLHPASLGSLLRLCAGITAWKAICGSAGRCAHIRPRATCTRRKLADRQWRRRPGRRACITTSARSQLERRAWGEPTRPGVWLGYSSIPWREAWKYGERAFR